MYFLTTLYVDVKEPASRTFRHKKTQSWADIYFVSENQGRDKIELQFAVPNVQEQTPLLRGVPRQAGYQISARILLVNSEIIFLFRPNRNGWERSENGLFSRWPKRKRFARRNIRENSPIASTKCGPRRRWTREILPVGSKASGARVWKDRHLGEQRPNHIRRKASRNHRAPARKDIHLASVAAARRE